MLHINSSHKLKNCGPERWRDSTKVTLVDSKPCGLVLALVNFRTLGRAALPNLGTYAVSCHFTGAF